MKWELAGHSLQNIQRNEPQVLLSGNLVEEKKCRPLMVL